MIKECTSALKTLLESAEANTVMAQGNITELKSLPAIVIFGPALHEVRSMRSQALLRETDTDSGTYTKEKAPRWYNLQFEVRIAAVRYRELADRLEMLSRLVQTTPLIRVTQEVTGRERNYTWDWREFPSITSTPNISGVYEANGELIVYDVEVYSGVQTTGPLITSIELGIGPASAFPSESDEAAEMEVVTEREE